VPNGVKRYVLAQFGVAVAVTLGIASLFATSGAKAVLLPCVLLWALLYTLGALNEGRAHAARLERARLLLVVPAGMLGIVLAKQVPAPAAWLWTGTAIYLAASLAALYPVDRKSDKDILKQQLI
jgi:hypothetical protein